jgi:hypothetical protein
MIKGLTLLIALLAGIKGLVQVARWINASVFGHTLLFDQLPILKRVSRLFIPESKPNNMLILLSGLGLILAAVLLMAGIRAWAHVLLVSTMLSIGVSLLIQADTRRLLFVDGVFLLALFVVFGFRFPVKPFPSFPQADTVNVETIAIPDGLPAPVERFFRQTYGDSVPVYHSAVMSGRGTLRFMGVTMPARIRFTHIPNTGYHHYLETTFYGFPIFSVNEHFINGHARFELPFGVQENEPNLDSAANQGLWAEMIAYPSVYITDPRVSWTAKDENSAILTFPYGDSEQTLTFTFDPENGSISRLETMRIKGGIGEPILWGGIISEVRVPGKSEAVQHWEIQWSDEDSPWLVANLEDLVLNADVDEYIKQKGY